MTPAEIQESLQQILPSLSKDTIEFLKSKRAKKDSKVAQKATKDKESAKKDSNVAQKATKYEESSKKDSKVAQKATKSAKNAVKGLKSEKKVFRIEANLESAKMEWMEDLKEQQQGQKDDKFHARFDFNGDLLPYKTDLDPKIGLHHHGEEPHRAGYTLNELFTLVRSSNLQQRSIALETLANIIKNFKKGLFDEIFQQNLLEEILRCDLVIILRTNLDESNDTVKENALKCLRQLLDNQFDEIALDFISTSSIQPSLPTKIIVSRESRDEYLKTRDELKDGQVIKLDVISGLLRTNLLQRMNYLLEQKSQLSKSAQQNIQSITIRIIRHSIRSAAEIINHDDLLRNVAKNCQDAKLTLKIFRLLICWSKSFGSTLIAKGFLKNLDSFLAKIDESTAEALKVWKVCLKYGFMTEMLDSLFPVWMKFFVNLRSKSKELNSYLTENLYSAFESVFECDEIAWKKLKEIFGLIRDIFMANPNSASLVNLMGKSLIRFSKEENLSQVIQMSKSFHQKLTSEICYDALETKSVLLRNSVDGRKRDPENLPSISVIGFGGKSLIEENSPFFLLNSQVKLMKILNGFNKNLTEFSIPLDYLNLITGEKSGQFIGSNWFLKSELEFLTRILSLDRKLEQLDQKLKLKLIHFLMPKLHNDQNELLIELFHHMIELMKNNELSEMFGDLSLTDEVITIEDIYSSYFPPIISQNQLQTLTERNSGDCLLPQDWIFLPILQIHNEQQSDESDARIDANRIRCCLRWIRMNLMSGLDIEPEILYSRLALVFLIAEDLFLDKDIKIHLREIMSRINLKRLKLRSKLPGIESTTDFYRELVQHHASVSYGDELFGSFLLIPTVKSSALRTIFWLDNAENLNRGFRMKSLEFGLNVRDFVAEYSDANEANHFAGVILKEHVKKEHNPFLYEVALENVKKNEAKVSTEALKIMKNRNILL